jgi:hypothetical protein
MLKRLFVFAILLVFAGGVAHAQSVPSCTLTGTVQDASGQPLKNGVINFDSIKTQVLAGGQTVARKIISINTDQNGVIGPNTFAQLLVNSITICDQLGNCGAPFSAIIPNQSTSPFGNMIMGTYLVTPVPNPAASGQVFGVNSNNTPEWQTVSGGRGNCSFVWNSTSSYTLNCPGFATLASPTFTGTVAVASGGTIQTPTLTLTGTGPATQQFFGSATTPIGSLSSGATAPNMNMAAGAYNNGTNWLASATTADIITEGSTGISFFENTGLTVGNTFTPTSIATLSASGLTLPTGSVLSAPTLTLANPLAIASGGTGNSAAPTAPQILIAQSATGYAPETVGGDAVLATNGNLTVTKTGGTPLGPLATASTPLSVANGGLGSGTAPSAGQILIAQTATTYTPQTMSGDVAVSLSGLATVSGLHFGPTNPVALPTTGPTSGGILYFSSNATLQSSGTLSASAPVLGGGAGGAPTTGARSGSTIVFGTTSGTLIGNDCAKFDASGNLVDAGGPCGISGGATYPNGSPPQVAGYSAANISEAETVSGDFTYARGGTNSYVATVTKTGGVAFSALATASVPLSIANGGRGSSTAPTAGQIDIAQSGTAFAGVTMSGDATINSAGAITVTKSGGTALTSIFAPIASPSFTGTMTFPDGSTYTTAGHNNMLALGIGAAAPTAAGNLLQATSSGNHGAVVSITNTTSGTNAGAGPIYLNNDVHSGWLMMVSSGYTASGPAVAGDSLQLASNGAGGMEFATNTTITPAPPVHFWLGNLEAARMMVVPAGTDGTKPWTSLFNLQNNATNNAGGTASGLLQMTANGNWGATTNLTNNATGAHANETMYLSNDASEYAAFQLTNTGFTDAATHNVALFGTSASQGLWINSVHNVSIYGGNATSILNYAGGGLGQFLSNGTNFAGLSVPGYAAIFGGNSGITGFNVGNGYLTGRTFGTIDITGAALSPGSGAWVTDGGAGGGAPILDLTPGGGFIGWTGAAPGGTTISAWNQTFSWSNWTLNVVHLANNANYGSASVTNGSLMSGSRDAFGYILASAWPVQLNFAKPFNGNPACIATAGAGSSGVIYTNAQNANNIQFGCVNYAGGPVCGGLWFAYHCADVY